MTPIWSGRWYCMGYCTKQTELRYHNLQRHSFCSNIMDEMGNCCRSNDNSSDLWIGGFRSFSLIQQLQLRQYLVHGEFIPAECVIYQVWNYGYDDQKPTFLFCIALYAIQTTISRHVLTSFRILVGYASHNTDWRFGKSHLRRHPPNQAAHWCVMVSSNSFLTSNRTHFSCLSELVLESSVNPLSHLRIGTEVTCT